MYRRRIRTATHILHIPRHKVLSTDAVYVHIPYTCTDAIYVCTHIPYTCTDAVYVCTHIPYTCTDTVYVHIPYTCTDAIYVCTHIPYTCTDAVYVHIHYIFWDIKFSRRGEYLLTKVLSHARIPSRPPSAFPPRVLSCEKIIGSVQYPETCEYVHLCMYIICVYVPILLSMSVQRPLAGV